MNKELYEELQSIAIKHSNEQLEVSDALSIARSIENRYQTEEVWKLKSQILLGPLLKYWPTELSGYKEFPESYKTKARLAEAEYRIGHLKHYIVIGREIDWEQLKEDSKLIKEFYDKR